MNMVMISVLIPFSNLSKWAARWEETVACHQVSVTELLRSEDLMHSVAATVSAESYTWDLPETVDLVSPSQHKRRLCGATITSPSTYRLNRRIIHPTYVSDNTHLIINIHYWKINRPASAPRPRTPHLGSSVIGSQQDRRVRTYRFGGLQSRFIPNSLLARVGACLPRPTSKHGLERQRAALKINIWPNDDLGLLRSCTQEGLFPLYTQF